MIATESKELALQLLRETLSGRQEGESRNTTVDRLESVMRLLPSSQEQRLVGLAATAYRERYAEADDLLERCIARVKAMSI